MGVSSYHAQKHLSGKGDLDLGTFMFCLFEIMPPTPHPLRALTCLTLRLARVCFTSLCYRIMRRLLGVVYSGLLLQSELKQSSIRVVSPPVQHRLCRRSEGCNQCSVPFNDHLFKFNLSLIHLE